MANNELKLSQFNRICRICRKEDVTLINIFFSDAAEVISKISSIQLKEGDCLPENICIPCMDKTTEFYQFRQLCEYSDAILRSILKSGETKPQPLTVPLVPEVLNLKKEIKEINNSTVITEKNNSKHESDMANENLKHVKSEDISEDFNNVLTLENEKNQKVMVKAESCTNSVNHKNGRNKRKIDIKVMDRVNCAHCQLSFEKSEIKVKHQELYHPESNYHYCYICTKERSSIYNTINQLRNHLKYHRSLPTYPCLICERKFRSNYQRTIHMRLHTGERPATCEICEKSFRDPRYLVIHLKTHSGEKPYSCDVCFKRFGHKFSLKVHMKTHTSERNHMCNLCGKSFRYSHNLKIHIRQHTGEKPYSCQLCFKSFISGSILSAHMLTHSENKRFDCKECGKKFKRSGDLTIHMRSHTGEKPYACTICGNRYKMSSHLTEHKKTHTGERNYVCEVCFKSFYNNKALQVHKNTHTGERSHSCKLCDRNFVHYTSLCAHIRKRHKKV